jgi:hypothetical protein
VVTKPDGASGEDRHQFPSIVHGGTVLFTTTERAQRSRIDLYKSSSRTRTTLIQGGGQAEYVAVGGQGYIVYVVDGSLRAVRFDPARLQIVGAPVPVADRVMTKASGAADFSVSATGTLTYVTGSDVVGLSRSIVWVDRQGREQAVDAPVRSYGVVRLSPDETRAAEI